MATTSIDGLVSGLSTSTLISQLMQAEAAPQTQLKARQTSMQSGITALQSVNTRVLALQEAAAKLTSGTAWTAMKATSSSDAVSASASSSAQPASLVLHVERLAQVHATAGTDRFATLDDTVTTGAVELSQAAADGTARSVSVDVGTGSLADVVKGINAAGLDVRASAVRTADGYALALTSTRSGAAAAFTLTGAGTQDVLTAGQDASVRVGGTGASGGTPGSGGLLLASATNSFNDAVPGVTFTASRLASDVTVSVSSDEDSVVAAMKAMVDAANTALTELRRVAAPSATATGRGILAGDATVRTLQQSLLSAVSASGAGSAGIAVNRSGAVTFDEEAFRTAFRADPQAVRTQLAGASGSPGTSVAERLSAVSSAATGSDGSLTTAISGRQSTVKDLTTRIEDWDRRLALRKTALQRQFSGLEVALSKMQSQSTWLAGQLAGLSSGSS